MLPAAIQLMKMSLALTTPFFMSPAIPLSILVRHECGACWRLIVESDAIRAEFDLLRRICGRTRTAEKYALA